MSGDFVAFEPSSLQQLSNKLDALAQTLEGNLSKLSSAISAAGGHVRGSGNIGLWAGKARTDANDMASRSRQAWELVRQGKAYKPPGFNMVFSPGLVNVDWAATSQGGRQAQKDAHDLNLGKQATRDQLAAAARSVANHKADKQYLATFWNSVDPKVAAELARVLHEQDAAHGEQKQPLSGGSKKILADLAAGLAAASRDGLLPSRAQTALENPPGDDMWSPAMLFKYGPKGKGAYDSKFLQVMGQKALDWRRTHEQMPRGRFYKDGTGHFSYAPAGAWYQSLGLRPSMDWSKIAPLVADNDPAAAILDRVSDSPEASRGLLQSKKYTHDLVNPDWVIPDFSGGKGVDISGPAGRVIVAGTSDRQHFPQETANAALNVMLEVAALRKDYGNPITDPKGNLELKKSLPEDLTRALGVMGRQYVPDLANSVSNNGGATTLSGKSGIILNKDDLRTYLTVLATDPTALGMFRGGVDSETVKATRDALLLGDYSSPEVKLLGRLNGMVSVAESNKRYGDAQLADMAAARRLQLLNTVVGIGTGVPLPSLQGKAQKGVDWLKFLAGQASGQAGGLFDTGNGAEAEYLNERSYDNRLAQTQLPAAQAILDLARLDPDKLPEDVAWPTDREGKTAREDARKEARETILAARAAANKFPLATPDHNRISLRNPDDVAKFSSWFNSLRKKVLDPHDDNTAGYELETDAHKNSWFKG
jgi:hypothetical protein